MLPREVQVEHWPDRTTYDLPRRPIGMVRYTGLILIGFAVLFAWSPATSSVRMLRHALEGSAGTADWFGGAFLLIFVLAAVMPFGLGLFILAGRTRLVVTRERVRATEIAGPLRWSRQMRAADIERLDVTAAKGRAESSAPSPAAAGFGALAARLRTGKPRLLLLGYPRNWLGAIAEELSGQLSLQGKPVAVNQVSLIKSRDQVSAEEASQQPADSNARLVETVGGIELQIPSRGIRKESSGLVIFGLVWCVFVGLSAGAALFGAGSNRAGSDLGPAGLGLFLLAFWALGLVMLLIGIHLGTRRWTLKADRHRLEAQLRSALRSRQWQWTAAEIREIGVGNSGVEINHRPLEEVQVFPRVGKKAGLLRGRSHEELAWIATTLRRALQLTPPNPTEAPNR